MSTPFMASRSPRLPPAARPCSPPPPLQIPGAWRERNNAYFQFCRDASHAGLNCRYRFAIARIVSDCLLLEMLKPSPRLLPTARGGRGQGPCRPLPPLQFPGISLETGRARQGDCSSCSCDMAVVESGLSCLLLLLPRPPHETHHPVCNPQMQGVRIAHVFQPECPACFASKNHEQSSCTLVFRRFWLDCLRLAMPQASASKALAASP